MKKLDKIVINNITIRNLEPTKKNFINKNFKFSAKGYLNDKKVKIFEVFDKNQGKLREFISNHNELSIFFPKLISYDNKYIVEEWVYGKTLKELNLQHKDNNKYSSQVIEIINLMWSIDYDKQVFDYITYIHDRVKIINNFNLTKIPLRINHNDLSLDNLLVTETGLKIIDNELLGCNNGWILNYKNSFLKDDFGYQNYISKETLNELWNVRMKWSKIVNKNFNKKDTYFKTLLKKLKII